MKNTILGISVFALTSLNAQWIESDFTVSGQKALGLRSLYFINKDTGWAVGDAISKAQILKTVDGGKNWVAQNSNSFENLDNVYFSSPNVGFTTGDNGTFLKTLDGGNTWSSVTTIPGSNFRPSYLSKFYFTSNYTGFYTTDYAIFKTNDSGENWNAVLENAEAPITNIAFNSEGVHGIAVCFSGKVYKTTDSGKSWDLVPQFTGSYFWDVSFTDKRIFISGAKALYQSLDTGNTWTEVAFSRTMPENGYESVSFPTDKIGFCAGSPYEIYNTTDGGNTWNYQVSLQNVYAPHIQMIDENIGYILADPSTGKFYKTNNGGNAENSTFASETSKNVSVRVYPNPANALLTLEFAQNALRVGYQILITNALGEVLYAAPISQQKSQVDLSNWEGLGLIFVQVLDSQNKSIAQSKIILD